MLILSMPWLLNVDVRFDCFNGILFDNLVVQPFTWTLKFYPQTLKHFVEK